MTPTEFKELPNHSRARSALALLADAQTYASDLELDPWQFAVEFHGLLQCGATTTDCRWLVLRGFVEHAREISLPGEQQRSFQSCASLRFSEATCFVLTEQGMALIDASVARQETGQTAGPKTSDVPSWNPDRHVLSFGEAIVKHFRVPAMNQEAILNAFQEEGWPERIDDPLPPKTDQNPKRRVHDTINSLNRNQKQPLIRFYGDGTGQGICWEPIDHETRRKRK